MLHSMLFASVAGEHSAPGSPTLVTVLVITGVIAALHRPLAVIWHAFIGLKDEFRERLRENRRPLATALLTLGALGLLFVWAYASAAGA